MTSIHRQTDATDASIRAHGCGPVSCCNALEEASDGDWRAKGKAGTDSALARVRASGATSVEFNARGLTSAEMYASLRAVAATDYRMDLPLKRYQGGDVKAMLRKRREVGGVLVIAVLYGVAQDAGVGVGSFRLGHWVCAYGETGFDDGDRVTVADPLRRQTVAWDVRTLVKAAERFGDAPGPADNSWGNGRGEAILVYPWRTWRQGYATQTAALSASTKALDATRKALAACQAGQQPTDPEALAEARAGGIRDAAAAAGAVK